MDLPPSRCPRCRIEMHPVSIGETDVQECERCSGLWVDVPSFEKICADREDQAALLGAASPAPVNAESSKVRYSPCPTCEQLMNRINFGRAGVVVDICKGHGIWFDRDELTRIVEYIRDVGIDPPRNKHQTDLEFEKRRTQWAMTRVKFGWNRPLDAAYLYQNEVAIASAGDVLSLLRN